MQIATVASRELAPRLQGCIHAVSRFACQLRTSIGATILPITEIDPAIKNRKTSNILNPEETAGTTNNLTIPNQPLFVVISVSFDSHLTNN